MSPKILQISPFRGSKRPNSLNSTQSNLNFKPAIGFVDSSKNQEYARWLAGKTPETFAGLKNAFSGMLMMWNKVQDDFKDGWNPEEQPENIDIISLFETVLKGDRRNMLRVISNTRHLSQKLENRLKVCAYLKKLVKKHGYHLDMKIDSFYSVKDFLEAVLHSSMKNCDEESSFEIIRFSQHFRVTYQKGEGVVTRQLGSFYYSHPVVKRLEFWIAALKKLFEVKKSHFSEFLILAKNFNFSHFLIDFRMKLSRDATTLASLRSTSISC